MNALRADLPLVLWDEDVTTLGEEQECASMVALTDDAGGEPELHFRPPRAQRARLARKWLYIRYTYASVCNIGSKSRAQQKHIGSILSLVSRTPILPAEAHVARLLEKQTRWSNPLLHPDERVRNSFLSDPAWVSAVTSRWY